MSKHNAETQRWEVLKTLCKLGLSALKVIGTHDWRSNWCFPFRLVWRCTFRFSKPLRSQSYLPKLSIVLFSLDRYCRPSFQASDHFILDTQINSRVPPSHTSYHRILIQLFFLTGRIESSASCLPLPSFFMGSWVWLVWLHQTNDFFSFFFAVCVRLISISTVCREEKQPYYNVTFYSSSSVPSPPLLYWTRWYQWRSLCKSLGQTEAFRNPCSWLASLVNNGIDWFRRYNSWWWVVLDAEIGKDLVSKNDILMEFLYWRRSLVAVSSVFRYRHRRSRQIEVIGYANAFGSSSFFDPIPHFDIHLYSAHGSTGVGVGTVILIAYLEVLDGVRYVKVLKRRSWTEEHRIGAILWLHRIHHLQCDVWMVTNPHSHWLSLIHSHPSLSSSTLLDLFFWWL